MPFTLELTDGTDTVDFITEDFQVEDGGLQVTPPEEVQTWTDPSTEGGSRLVDSRLGNRTITITFQISGQDRQDIRQGINRINALLRTATLHSLGQGEDRVSLLYGWDGVNEVDNFEVFYGKLVLPDDVLSVEKMLTTWGSGEAVVYRLRGCQLTLTVSPHAYGLSPSTGTLIELPLSNRNGTNVTGGLIVHNFTDPRVGFTYNGNYVDNYVDILGEDILGDSPAKVRIEIRENFSNASELDMVRIGAHENNGVKTHFHWADSDVSLFIPGAPQSNGSYVLGGTYWRANAATSRTYTGRFWRVRIQNPENYGSKKYRVFMSTGFWPMFYRTGTPMQLTVTNDQYMTLAEGPIMEQHWSSSGHAMIQDLGVIQLPPYSPKLPNPQDIYLTLNLLGGGPQDYLLSLNYIWLLPVEAGYRVLKLHDGLVNFIPSYGTLVDDNWEGLSYLTGAAGSVSAVQDMFAPITLTPGKDHRIYFNFAGHDYIPQLAYHYNVRVFYSPAYTGAV
jgi:hypothetical protein